MNDPNTMYHWLRNIQKAFLFVHLEFLHQHQATKTEPILYDREHRAQFLLKILSGCFLSFGHRVSCLGGGKQNQVKRQ